MHVGWHHLDDSDTAAPLAASTFLDTAGVAAGMRSPERLARPYFKGRPAARPVADMASFWHGRGCRVQIGNEPNLPQEGFGGGPADYAAWFLEVANLCPAGTRLYYAGISPSGDWRAYYTHPLARSAIARSSGLCVHAYGTVDQMREVVAWLAQTFAGAPLWLGEINFGAGQEVDRDRWAAAHLRPFLDWCSSKPQIEAACYFAYRWPSPDMPLPTPVDGAGTGIERVLRACTAPEPTPPSPDPAPVDGQKGQFVKRAYLHQFDQLGERSVPEIAATLRLGGVTEIACKTHQELTWLGNATDGDTSPLAFRSLGDVRARYEDFRREGIRMVPWCVPMGTKVAEEAQRADEVARECEAVIELDLEPYAGFWEGPYDRLTAYLEGILTRGAHYEVNFDARGTGWRPFGTAPFALACARAVAVWTQSYWTTFQRDAEVVVAESLATLALLEVPPEKAGVIYPWDGAADYDRVTRRLHEQVPLVGRIGMWRMGTAGPDVYQALAAIPTAAAPTPAPAGDIDRAALWGQVYDIANAFRSTGRHADLVTGNGLEAAYQASKVMWGVDPRE